MKITGRYMLKCLIEFELYNDVHILFCGDKHTAFLLLVVFLKELTKNIPSGESHEQRR